MRDTSLLPSRGPTGRHLLAVLLLVGVAALAGCGFLAGDTTSLPSGEAAAESYLSLDGYTATAHIERSGEADRRLRLEVDPDGGNSRSTVLAPPSNAGNVYLANGSTLIRYNATENEYITVSTGGTDRFDRGGQRIEDAISVAREGGETSDPAPVGGAPLPVVPNAGNDSSRPATQFDVSFGGTEQIAGREAYRINYEAAGDRSTGVLEQSLWVDTEYFITLKATQVSRFGGNRSTYTFRLSNVTFEPGFGADHFTFDPPAGATRDAADSFSQQTYDSRASLAAAADLSVPDPAVPERFSLVSAYDIQGPNFTAVQLQYRSSTSAVYVTKTTERSYTNLTTGEAVTVGDRTGRYRSSGTQALVVWECDGTVYTVVGDLQKSTLLDIARSVGCE
jgi:outer membrane lipoprotein-sorting protein